MKRIFPSIILLLSVLPAHTAPSAILSVSTITGGENSLTGGNWTNYKAIFAQGYKTPYDGGGGAFYNYGTSCIEDSGTCFHDTAGNAFHRKILGAYLTVRQFGSSCTGIGDDTAGIEAAIAHGGSIMIPRASTCIVGDADLGHTGNYTLFGQDKTAIIKRKSSSKTLMILADGNLPAPNIVIRDLSFDMNGCAAFCGVVAYSVQNFRAENNRFFDSRPAGPGNKDIYGLVIGSGKYQSKDIWMLHNRAEHLQMEVDDAKHVTIAFNHSSDAQHYCFVGAAIRDGDRLEDYNIHDNICEDPYTYGVAIALDVGENNIKVRDIHIEGNIFIYKKRNPYHAILIGTVRDGTPTGDSFSVFTVKNNTITVGDGLAIKGALILIQGPLGTTNAVSDGNVVGNTISSGSMASFFGVGRNIVINRATNVRLEHNIFRRKSSPR